MHWRNVTNHSNSIYVSLFPRTKKKHHFSKRWRPSTVLIPIKSIFGQKSTLNMYWKRWIKDVATALSEFVVLWNFLLGYIKLKIYEASKDSIDNVERMIRAEINGSNQETSQIFCSNTKLRLTYNMSHNGGHTSFLNLVRTLYFTGYRSRKKILNTLKTLLGRVNRFEHFSGHHRTSGQSIGLAEPCSWGSSCL